MNYKIIHLEEYMYKIETESYRTQAFEKFGTNLPIDTTMEAYYSSLTLEHMKDLCRIYGIKGYSKLKKSELVTLVLTTVFAVEECKELFYSCTVEEYKIIIELAKKNSLHHKAIPFAFMLRLINLGLVFLTSQNNQMYVCLPREVASVFLGVATGKNQKEAKLIQEVLTSCLAITHLYGVVKIDEAARIHTKYKGKVSPTVFAKSLHIAARKLVDFGIEKEYIFSLTLADTYEVYYKENEKYEFYYPKKVVFDAYKNDQYYENDTRIDSMRMFLAFQFITAESLRNDLLNDLLTYFYNDGEFSECLIFFTKYGLKFKDEKHVQQMGGRLDLFYKGLRFRKYRGNKPE